MVDQSCHEGVEGTISCGDNLSHFASLSAQPEAIDFQLSVTLEPTDLQRKAEPILKAMVIVAAMANAQGNRRSPGRLESYE